jgi:hypothetical protein
MLYAISKQYSWTLHPTILQDLIRRHRRDHTVIFDFSDGENVFLSGALELIKETQRIFNIPKEKVIIYSFFNIDVDFAVCKRTDSYGFVGPALKHLREINNDIFDKKFLSLSGRIDIFRLRLAKHLHTNWLNDTILSFKPNIASIHCYFNNESSVFYQDEINWAEQYAPINFDTVERYGISGSIGYTDSLATSATYYHRYFLEIATETDSKNPYWITEKTLRPIAFGKPFILFSGQHALHHLRDLGFQTFSPWIDESYDLIENQFDRFDAITKEIDRIAAMSYDQLKYIAKDINDILIHNQRNLLLVKNY